MSKNRRSFLFAAVCCLVVALTTVAHGQSLTVRGDRWLTLTQKEGPVALIPYQSERRAARIGDRLVSAGDTVITGSEASARLDVDTGTGFVTMAENSRLSVQSLSITADGGRVTELAVDRGQVRLQVRPLTNPGSRLEIYTPAGVSGVRGTEFGIAVQPNGQTGVATLAGSVATSAQGETVIVGTQQQSTVRPGEPPTPPEPLRDDPTLFVTSLSTVRGQRAVRIIGYTDTVNLLEIDNELRTLDREGRFDLVIPLPAVDGDLSRYRQRRILALVTTPLGTEQKYELVAP
ncbi:MAG: FecR family protein [Phormidesmis sp.]